MLPKSFWSYIADVIGASGKDIAAGDDDNNLDNHSSSSGDLEKDGDMEKDMHQWWSPGDADPIAAKHIKDE